MQKRKIMKVQACSYRKHKKEVFTEIQKYMNKNSRITYYYGTV